MFKNDLHTINKVSFGEEQEFYIREGEKSAGTGPLFFAPEEKWLMIEQKNRELQKLNEQLIREVDELRRLISALDKENYGLKKRVKEKILERAGSKNMDYEEFKLIFPDELSCLRYLEEEKWKEGFVCKKCKKNKYLPGNSLLGRRCTHCGFNESIKAHTVFHSSKLPLHKAFYILHLTISGREDISAEKLSTMLNLRKSTCWRFRKKLQDIISEKGFTRKDLQHWGTLIFSGS